MFLEEKDNRKNATKLHKQFGHPTGSKLISLIRKAGVKNDNLEEEITNIVMYVASIKSR